MADNAPAVNVVAAGRPPPLPRTFGPPVSSVDGEAPTIDPANNLEVTGPPAVKPFPTPLNPIVDAKVAAFNKMNQAHAGDDVYLDPDWVRAMIRVESGHDLKAVRLDPMQVNNRGDWPEKDDYKSQIVERRSARAGVRRQGRHRLAGIQSLSL